MLLLHLLSQMALDVSQLDLTSFYLDILCMLHHRTYIYTTAHLHTWVSSGFFILLFGFAFIVNAYAKVSV